MTCPHCAAATTRDVTKTTQLGYRIVQCVVCCHQCNARTGTPLNHLEFPTDIVLLVVVWRLRYKLSLRDLAEMLLERGVEFTHEAVRAWEARFAPLLADHLRTKRKGQAGRFWHADETYVNVKGVWTDLSRAIDRDGNLVDSMLSEKRDMEAATRFFRQALDVAGQTPERVTTDGHDSYPRAMRERLGEQVTHGCNQYLNNRIEQDHRGIKQRYYSTRGYESVESASRFCRTFDEQRQFYRVRRTMCERGPPLAAQRQAVCVRWTALMSSLIAA